MKSTIEKLSPNIYKKLCKIKHILNDITNNLILYVLLFSPPFSFVLKLFKTNWYLTGKFISLDDLLNLFPKKVKILTKSTKNLYHSAPIFNIDFPEQKLESTYEFKSYAAIFNDVKIIGGSSIVIFAGKYALYDLKFQDKQNRFKYSDESIKCYNKDYCLIQYKNNGSIIDSAISLNGNYSLNYYHLLYEICIKFKYINESDIDIGIPIIIDKICLNIPQYAELLSLLNKQKREIISVAKDTIVSIKNLYYISCPNVIPPNYINDKDIQSRDVLFDIDAISYLRSSLLPCSSDKKFPKKIYLSRKMASGRRKFNEDEVFTVLEKYGFQIISPENYSIADQISMFGNADYIVGGSGAAFTNLLFCQPSCRIIILYKNQLPFSGFSTISAIVGSKLLYITDGISLVEDMDNIHDDFIINTLEFKMTIAKWLL